jgi:hypothetical protein
MQLCIEPHDRIMELRCNERAILFPEAEINYVVEPHRPYIGP